ncbi:MAG TPA: hypothetical protein VLM91_23890, partial [Candidatus Methylomirabilis sp.]|nr:hypothetical protein [Candidatus Methylomirabilis sp.]
MAGKARGKSKAPKVIRAERFELVDRTGTVCSQLMAREDGEPGLAVADADGKARVLVGMRQDGSV